jgi:hypothetical protein
MPGQSENLNILEGGYFDRLMDHPLCWVNSCGRKAPIRVSLSSTWTVDMCETHALDYEQKANAVWA